MQSRNLGIAAAGLLSLFALSACHAQDNAQTAGKAAVVVNGQAIPESLVDQLVNQRVAQGQPDTPDLRKALVDQLVLRELGAQEAGKKNLDKNPDVAAQINMMREDILFNAYLSDYVKTHPASDAELKAEYDKMKAAVGDKEYHVSHILVPTEKQAQDIINQLKHGANFAQLAKKYSKDPGSKDRGGDLDWVTPGQLVAPFSQAMVKLAKGQYTAAPVKTDYGYHVIRMADVRALKAPPFEQLKPQLAQRLQQQQVQKALSDLKAHATIEMPGAGK